MQADKSHIWANPSVPVHIDLEIQQERLRLALGADPGMERDDMIVAALANERVLLESETLAEWAHRPREHLEWERQEARLVLARARARGLGRSSQEAVVRAWAACLSHDPTCEEAACALMRAYSAQSRWALVEATYRRCRAALEELGLRPSPALDEVHTSSRPTGTSRPGTERSRAPVQPRGDREQRIVTCLFVELSGPLATGQWLGPEELSERVGGVLAEVVGHVESFGGAVTAVSGTGVVALFGAPTAHEDDPERALRAAYRALGSVRGGPEGLSVRAGVETGRAVVGRLLGGAPHYAALGEVVATAAALQSVARPASVLVGPATHAATLGLFDWASTEEVPGAPGTRPLLACYLGRPKARPSGQAGRRGGAGRVPVVGRNAELCQLREALRGATVGEGGVVLISGEPGLGKTRLVHECRKLFMAWVGATSGRLPLWLEARAASYAASRPYGLYQQLLSAWLGVAPEEGPEVMRAAVERGLEAIFGGDTGDGLPSC